MRNQKHQSKGQKLFKFTEIGEIVYGKIISFSSSRFGLLVGIDDLIVPISQESLKSLFRTALADKVLKIGAKIEIEYVGDTPSRFKANPTKLFKLTINDKEIIGTPKFTEIKTHSEILDALDTESED